MESNPAWQKFGESARSAAPFLFALFLTLLGVVPLQISNYGQIAPPLALLAVFFWGVYRPELLPPLAVAVLGLLLDILSGAPLGQFMLIFLLVQGSLVTQRQLFLAHNFFILWWGFAVTAALAGVLVWLISSLSLKNILPIHDIAVQAIIAVALFPVVAALCHKLLRWLVGDEL
jgi:rod shape-determining protein MreD